MAEEGSTEGNTSSPSASTNQMPRAAHPHDSENLTCPICMDAIRDQVSVSWCSHAFCFPCILEWSRSTAVCPICREPFQYLLRKVADNNYEVYSIGHYISFTRLSRGRRPLHRSAGRRRHRSTGHRQHSSRRARERERSRSPRQHHSGHSRGQHDSPGSSRQQQSGAQDTSTDTSSDEDRDARSEQDVPVHRRRSERYQRGRRVSSREPQARRSRSRRRSRGPDGHRDR